MYAHLCVGGQFKGACSGDESVEVCVHVDGWKYYKCTCVHVCMHCTCIVSGPLSDREPRGVDEQTSLSPHPDQITCTHNHNQCTCVQYMV